MNATVNVKVGDVAYVRARCTRRAAIGEVRYYTPDGTSCVVLLGTDWYNWDDPGQTRLQHKAGQTVTVRTYVLEAIRE